MNILLRAVFTYKAPPQLRNVRVALLSKLNNYSEL